VSPPRPDEWAQPTSRLPPLDAVIEVDAEVLAERLASLPDDVNALVRLFDGRRTLREVIAGSGRDEVEAAAALSRLHEQGVLRVAATSAAPPAEGTPAPTPAPDGAEWFEGPEDVPLAALPERSGDAELERHAAEPPRGVEWVRAMLARLRS
jgi:hypothetical protein